LDACSSEVLFAGTWLQAAGWVLLSSLVAPWLVLLCSLMVTMFLVYVTCILEHMLLLAGILSMARIYLLHGWLL
jgi:hypothetical protein